MKYKVTITIMRANGSAESTDWLNARDVSIEWGLLKVKLDDDMTMTYPMYRVKMLEVKRVEEDGA